MSTRTIRPSAVKTSSLRFHFFGSVRSENSMAIRAAVRRKFGRQVDANYVSAGVSAICTYDEMTPDEEYRITLFVAGLVAGIEIGKRWMSDNG